MPVEPATARALIRGVVDLQRALRCLSHDSLAPGTSTALLGVLHMITEHGGRAVDIAQRLGVSSPVLSRHLAELEERGFITRTQDPTDRRAQLLEVTEIGQEQLARAEEDRVQALLSLLGDWDEDQALTCRSNLTDLTVALQSYRRKPSPYTAATPAGD
ncbi:transcriptional regulator [Arthrobacter woluwensis]|uniref:MarR family winged helix-turn-helix transcriptional regulator n=1 Tax=Arthrobacter woluwensis TaxID=156980 RepID=UPI000D13C8BD|nr:MarR family transcriptional regulator [Arthrobacter woluwensis]PSS43659.1 transcriptional regulator [Arthrobacter woluwensis]